MKMNITKMVSALIIFGLLSSNCIVKAEKKEDKEKAQIKGDIYGQVKIIGDVDGDGKKDLIFGATDGKVHIWSSGTNKEIKRPPHWPLQLTAPIVTPVEVIAGEEGYEIVAASMDGNVGIYDMMGKQIGGTSGAGQISEIEIEDINGNGHSCIITGDNNGNVTCYDRTDKEVKWLYKSSAGIGGGIVAIDIDGKGKKCISFKNVNDKVELLDNDGGTMTGWPKSLPSQNGAWGFDTGAGDIDGDGNQEIITTTAEGKFVAYNKEGKVIKSFDIGKGSHCAPIVTDLEGDGEREYVVTKWTGEVCVYDKSGKMKEGFPKGDSNISIYAPPVIIDVDGDGKLDIVYAANMPFGNDEEAGFVNAISADGKQIKDFPKYVGRVQAQPTFADLDGDGKLEMIVAGGIGKTGPQINIFKLNNTKPRIKYVVLDQEVTYK